jgi:hypothetical protein
MTFAFKTKRQLLCSRDTYEEVPGPAAARSALAHRM